MRNRDAIGYSKVHGRSVESTRELQAKIEAATRRLKVEEEAYWRERQEQLEAIKNMLVAEEGYQVAEARTSHMRNRRKPT